MTSTRLRSIDGNDSAVRSAAEIASDQRSMVYSRRNSSEDPIDKPGRWASCPNTVPGFSTTRIRTRSSKTSRNTRCPSKTRSPRRRKFESVPEPRIDTISGSLRLSCGSVVMKNRISRRNRSCMLKPSYGIFSNRGSRFGAGRFAACATAGASNNVRRVSLIRDPAETEGRLRLSHYAESLAQCCFFSIIGPVSYTHLPARSGRAGVRRGYRAESSHCRLGGRF